MAREIETVVELEIDEVKYNFEEELDRYGLDLKPLSIETLQVNITKLCNQACLHCHVDSSPKRTESMDRKTVDRVIEILANHPSIKTIDITGGAPELNPYFDELVRNARELGKHVIVRHNLTVQFDGNPVTGESKDYLPIFFAEQGVEVISSLPYYQEYFTDKQRGKGVFNKSVEGIRRLNEVGFGIAGSGKILNLVYNPVGPYLPAAQGELEQQYREELSKIGLHFNSLFTITNMPIHRFGETLKRRGGWDEYMTKLVSAFNPVAASGVMCRSLVSVGYDGKLYDCDFNQMLELDIDSSKVRTIFDQDFGSLVNRNIVFKSHCFGCTAGAGSSCGGAVA